MKIIWTKATWLWVQHVNLPGCNSQQQDDVYIFKIGGSQHNCIGKGRWKSPQVLPLKNLVYSWPFWLAVLVLFVGYLAAFPWLWHRVITEKHVSAAKGGRPKCVCISPTCMLFGCFFQDGPVDSSIEIVPKLVKGAQTPGRQPGTARPGLGTRLKEERLDGLAV